jgi:hypothetical protein
VTTVVETMVRVGMVGILVRVEIMAIWRFR